MPSLAVRADSVSDLQALRDACPGPVTLGEPATYVDDAGDEWYVYDDPRISPEQVGRAAAHAEGRQYRPPAARTPDDDPEISEYDRHVDANRDPRRASRAKVNPEGLRPKPTEQA